ncbi:CRR6 family NdhI maturation factor [Leptolyngbya boryana CZ1]|uniref:CRR6 family NdhI maturation factor n=1 Tax=Leptolyngbya boryana CZ1 TaxID=3060204 RepID=A0AA96WRP8_LEPBY|nr:MULTISPECIES: CRR6 family NdhI maturation factor [Leptolyngbya]MBN8559562.1 CRR6 family NdhI maturation factor [Leptolyngbya sp. UWPOB_LEPTO1]WNZ44761.1 CRR6 family NdhI maturation factor [Leptolyngbya boryana CZ1]
MIIHLTAEQIDTVDLSQVIDRIESLKPNLREHEQSIQFKIDYPLDPSDPREYSEIPEIRLWFIRLDATYPWMPFLLNWSEKELGRYAAMLVPHQIQKDGIEYNPEALEIFVMQKTFVMLNWLTEQKIEARSRVKSMTKTLGYELDDAFFLMLEGR